MFLICFSFRKKEKTLKYLIINSRESIKEQRQDRYSIKLKEVIGSNFDRSDNTALMMMNSRLFNGLFVTLCAICLACRHGKWTNFLSW